MKRNKLAELREQDLDLRPSGYEPDELPDCSIPPQGAGLNRDEPCAS